MRGIERELADPALHVVVVAAGRNQPQLTDRGPYTAGGRAGFTELRIRPFTFPPNIADVQPEPPHMACELREIPNLDLHAEALEDLDLARSADDRDAQCSSVQG